MERITAILLDSKRRTTKKMTFVVADMIAHRLHDDWHKSTGMTFIASQGRGHGQQEVFVEAVVPAKSEYMLSYVRGTAQAHYQILLPYIK